MNIRFLISRVSHLVTRRTVRSLRVRNRTPNFGCDDDDDDGIGRVILLKKKTLNSSFL